MDQADQRAGLIVHEGQPPDPQRPQALVDHPRVLQENDPPVGADQHANEERGDDQDHEDALDPARCPGEVVGDRVGQGQAEGRRDRPEPQGPPDDAPREWIAHDPRVIAEGQDAQIRRFVAEEADEEQIEVGQDKERQQHAEGGRDEPSPAPCPHARARPRGGGRRRHRGQPPPPGSTHPAAGWKDTVTSSSTWCTAVTPLCTRRSVPPPTSTR